MYVYNRYPPEQRGTKRQKRTHTFGRRRILTTTGSDAATQSAGRSRNINSSTPRSLFQCNRVAYKIQQLAPVQVKKKFKQISSNLSYIAMVLRRRGGRTTQGQDGADDQPDIGPAEIRAWGRPCAAGFFESCFFKSRCKPRPAPISEKDPSHSQGQYSSILEHAWSTRGCSARKELSWVQRVSFSVGQGDDCSHRS
jgi:hypothetical protein